MIIQYLIRPFVLMVLVVSTIVITATNTYAHWWFGFSYWMTLNMFGFDYPGYGIVYFGHF